MLAKIWERNQGLLCQCLTSLCPVCISDKESEKRSERDKVESQKVGNWAETQDSLVEGPVAAEGKDGLSA